MSTRQVNATFVKCDRCSREVEDKCSHGWTYIRIMEFSSTTDHRDIHLCDPCTGIFNRMMETTT
jgi:hypothetical protein